MTQKNRQTHGLWQVSAWGGMETAACVHTCTELLVSTRAAAVCTHLTPAVRCCSACLHSSILLLLTLIQLLTISKKPRWFLHVDCSQHATIGIEADRFSVLSPAGRALPSADLPLASPRPPSTCSGCSWLWSHSHRQALQAGLC